MEKQAASSLAETLATIATCRYFEKQTVKQSSAISPELAWGLGGAGVGGLTGLLSQIGRPKEKRKYLNSAALGALLGGIAGAGGRYMARQTADLAAQKEPQPAHRPAETLGEVANALIRGSAEDRALPFGIAGAGIGASNQPSRFAKHLAWLYRRRDPLGLVQRSLQSADNNWTPRPYSGEMPTTAVGDLVPKLEYARPPVGAITAMGGSRVVGSLPLGDPQPVGFTAPPEHVNMTGDDVARFLLEGKGRPDFYPIQRTSTGDLVTPMTDPVRYVQDLKFNQLPAKMQQDVRARAKELHFGPKTTRPLSNRVLGGVAGAVGGSFIPSVLDWLLRKSQEQGPQQ